MNAQSIEVKNFPNTQGLLEASDAFADAVMKLRQEKHDRIIQAYLQSPAFQQSEVYLQSQAYLQSQTQAKAVH